MKISEKFLFFSVMILIFVGCRKNNILIKQINVSVNGIKENYSTLINSYEVIPIDNNPDAYFRFSHKAIFDENIWLFCNPNDAKVIAFDSKGKFLNTIGKKGRGPGEINYINDFTYNSNENSVVIYERSKAKKYLINGSYVGENDLGFPPTKVIRFDDQFVIEKQMPTGDTISDYELRLVDKNFRTIDKRLPQKNFDYSGSSLYGQLSRCQINKDYAYYFSLSGDTIFHIKNQKIFPAYLLSYDKDIFIQEIFTEANPGTNQEANKNMYGQIHYFENDENCFVFFQDNGISYCFIYNTGTNKNRLFKDAIVPNSIKDNQVVVLTNSIYLEKMITDYIDPSRTKCSNKTLLDSLIANAKNDFQIILRMNLNLN